jgi:hypothetical protein
MTKNVERSTVHRKQGYDNLTNFGLDRRHPIIFRQLRNSNLYITLARFTGKAHTLIATSSFLTPFGQAEFETAKETASLATISLHSPSAKSLAVSASGVCGAAAQWKIGLPSLPVSSRSHCGSR